MGNVLVQVGYELLCTKALALLELSDWTVQVPLCDASPKNCQVTYPSGTYMSFVSPGLHMRYILAAKSHVISLSAEANGIDGVSLAVAELEYGYELSRPGVSDVFRSYTGYIAFGYDLDPFESSRIAEWWGGRFHECYAWSGCYITELKVWPSANFPVSK